MNQNFEKMLVEQCAPTLAGVKPASLFRIHGDSLEKLCRSAQQWNHALQPFGIRVFVLKKCQAASACMIYVYRVRWISKILSDPQNRDFLLQEGYTPTGTEGMLQQLSGRFCMEAAYPHEIGVFLGYPLEDVIGFIENHGWNYLCCGYWKVYGNPEAAQRCFAQYRSCTDYYKNSYETGTPLLNMVVAA